LFAVYQVVTIHLDGYCSSTKDRMKLGIYSVSSSAITLLTLHRNGNLFLAAYGFTFFFVSLIVETAALFVFGDG